VLSVIVPFHDEEGNVSSFFREIVPALERCGLPWEIVAVDDGSTDGTYAELLAQKRGLDARQEGEFPLTLIRFVRRFGQTAALQAGIDAARGEWLIFLDGDLQNDPADIPRLFQRAERDGWHLVNGWRRDRKDFFWSRRVPSRLWNFFLRRFLGVPLHDVGCTLRVCRREVFEETPLYGQMHRLIPVLAHWRGYRVAEEAVGHRARRWGSSKYGWSRAARCLLDLASAKFLVHHFNQPMFAFGWVGLGSLGVASAAAGVLAWMKLFRGTDITGNPFIFVAFFGVVVGLQFLMMGLLGELMIRIHYQERGRRSYKISQKLCREPERPEEAARKG
jgi:glycosyltransferase involved in cell wall biosynthesis